MGNVFNKVMANGTNPPKFKVSNSTDMTNHTLRLEVEKGIVDYGERPRKRRMIQKFLGTSQ